jgi:hypothetical protein
MAVPGVAGDEAIALGTRASAERYGLPGANLLERDSHEPGQPAQRPGNEGLP